MNKLNKLRLKFMKQNSENEFKYKSMILDYLLSTEKDKDADKRIV